GPAAARPPERGTPDERGRSARRRTAPGGGRGGFVDGRLILIGTGASLAAGLATGIGALPVLFMRRLSERVHDALLGFAAGVMLAASFLSLILPGIEAVRAETGSGTAG